MYDDRIISHDFPFHSTPFSRSSCYSAEPTEASAAAGAAGRCRNRDISDQSPNRRSTRSSRRSLSDDAPTSAAAARTNRPSMSTSISLTGGSGGFDLSSDDEDNEADLQRNRLLQSMLEDIKTAYVCTDGEARRAMEETSFNLAEIRPENVPDVISEAIAWLQINCPAELTMEVSRL